MLASAQAPLTYCRWLLNRESSNSDNTLLWKKRALLQEVPAGSQHVLTVRLVGSTQQEQVVGFDLLLIYQLESYNFSQLYRIQVLWPWVAPWVPLYGLGVRDQFRFVTEVLGWGTYGSPTWFRTNHGWLGAKPPSSPLPAWTTGNHHSQYSASSIPV